jgi:hypothetical protein
MNDNAVAIDAVSVDHEMAYLTRREAQERAAAEQSADLGARRVHREMADRYARRRLTVDGPRIV